MRNTKEKIAITVVVCCLVGYILGNITGCTYCETKRTNDIETTTIAITTTELTTVETTTTQEVTTNAKPKSNRVSLGTYELTAYCACSKCCGKSDGITASGTKATQGRTIAADTSILPFGTAVYINGQKYIVEDKGGAVKGKRIDIFFNSHQEAIKFGRQYATVYIKTE